MTDQPQPRKHLARSIVRGKSDDLRGACGNWEITQGTQKEKRAAHRAHRVEMGETVKPRKPTLVEQLAAEVHRLTAERDRYRNAWRNARTRARDSAADEAMWRRIVTSTEQDRDHVLADNDRLTAELQQARQQTAARIATEIRQHCPDHGESDTCRGDCHCEIADEITRLYTPHAHPCTDPACGPCSFDRAIPPTTGTAEHPVTHNWQPSEVRGIERCTHPGCHARRVPAMDAATHNPAAVFGD